MSLLFYQDLDIMDLKMLDVDKKADSKVMSAGKEPGGSYISFQILQLWGE